MILTSNATRTRLKQWLPPLLLMLALSSLFVFQSDGSFTPRVGLRGDSAQ